MRYILQVQRRAALVLAFLCAFAARARGDGAFPDEMQIFLPADQPHRIVVAATFGLLESQDDGQSWRWVCEEAVTPRLSAYIYAMGAAPSHTLYAATNSGVSVSRDDLCSFADASGILEGANVLDIFADPVDPMRALALGTPRPEAGTSLPGVYETRNGGMSFLDTPLFVDTENGILNGVEIATTDPQIVYVTLKHTLPLRPALVRSHDGGTTWQTLDLAAVVGAFEVRIAQVSRTDPRTLYLRVIDTTAGDKLVISKDGGDTFRVALQLSAAMTSFTERQDGSLIVGTKTAGSKISADAGMTWTDWAGAPQLRALAERGGALYACGDNWVDHFAVGVSRDSGATWTPLLTFDKICGPKDCPNIQTVCARPWQTLMSFFEIPPTVCGQTPPSPDAGMTMTQPGGCGCTVGGRASRVGIPALLCVLVFGIARGVSKRRAHRRRA